ncbi:replication-associated recombination protein A [Pseudodesulfovibrio sp. zrk46]|uniref:replication-associated recombination protein A n=1 Tax=Pseudodesulfovibrio sp. zrk46 TaxID=2725288 RepID=UPI001449B337|nr:replication-associated recombination protein A [Pseudodesulfovibrio sp. zrk46]QJB57716.1 replication-associated recombination protein A [Pseudodesulfovibrio sp. zrk46]
MKLEIEDAQPLADRIRPTSLDDFVGQGHIRNRIEAITQSKRLPSLLLFGPPGCGKSTLALLLAKISGKRSLRVSAPEAGLTALRKRLPGHDILILDELHRFSKAQQDFFLPILETGEITLLATTTENPSFSVTRQLLSRLHVLRLRPLSRGELAQVVVRGAAELSLELEEDSQQLLAAMSGGDARTLLNLLEYTAQLPKDQRNAEKLRESLPEIVVRGDRDGDSHYELASALIKSIRGSDPDAALYYLACLLESGEDPRFVTRRLIISASEDVGLGDPNALPQAMACHQAIEAIGMPEGFIPMAQTAVYLALAPKSNSTYAAYRTAQKEVRENGPKPVPLHLRNATSALQREWGYGRGYLYPHNFPRSWADQDYLPNELTGRKFYHPKDQGEEPRLQAWLRQFKKSR